MGNWLSWLGTSDEASIEDPVNGTDNETNRESKRTAERELIVDRLRIRPSAPCSKWMFAKEKSIGTPEADTSTEEPPQATSNNPCIKSRDDEKQTTRCSTRRAGPAWNQFLSDVEADNEEKQLKSGNEEILRDITSMIETTFESLRKSISLFDGCKVHKVGSIGEGTKVGVFDEFDFMIELVALEERLLPEVAVMTNKSKFYNGVDVTKYEFPLKYLSIPYNEVDYSKYYSNPKLCSSLKSVVSKEVFKALLPNWEPGLDLSRIGKSDKNKASTIRLRWKDPQQTRHPQDIFLDFSFCVPFEWTPEKRHLFIREGSEDELNALSHRYYLLLRNNKPWHATCVLREKSMMLNFKYSASVRRCYRLAKLVVRNLLPPQYDYKLDKLEGLVPSYWLKQIILFMIEQYPEEEFWDDTSTADRVLEVLETLLSCIQAKTLANFFLPGRNHVCDNSKGRDRNMCARYLPLTITLIRLTAQDLSTSHLDTLSTIGADFSKTLLQEAHKMRFVLMLLRYNALVKKDKRMLKNTVYFINSTDITMLQSVFSEYAHFHLPNLTICGEGKTTIIHESGVYMSLDKKISSILEDPWLFPDDWVGLYNTLCMERIPDCSRYFGQWEKHLLPSVGETVRKIFVKGENPDPGDILCLALEFSIQFV